MSKHSNKHHQVEQQPQSDAPLAGGEQPIVGEQNPPEPEAQSTEPEVHNAMTQVVEQLAAPEELPKVTTTMGIGQFVRHMLLKSNKTNAEILELVQKHFPESKTTPACIAWYKSDLRKKGLLAGGATRGSAKIVELSAEDLAELVK